MQLKLAKMRTSVSYLNLLVQKAVNFSSIR